MKNKSLIVAISMVLFASYAHSSFGMLCSSKLQNVKATSALFYKKDLDFLRANPEMAVHHCTYLDTHTLINSLHLYSERVDDWQQEKLATNISNLLKSIQKIEQPTSIKNIDALKSDLKHLSEIIEIFLLSEKCEDARQEALKKEEHSRIFSVRRNSFIPHRSDASWELKKHLLTLIKAKATLLAPSFGVQVFKNDL